MVSPAACFKICDCGLSGHQDVHRNSVSVRAWSLCAPCAGEPEGEAVRRRGQGADGRCRDRPTRRSQKGAGAPQSPDAPPAPRPASGGPRPLLAGPPLRGRLRPRGAPSAASLPGAGAAVSPGPAPSRRERQACSPRGGRGVVPAPSSLRAPGPPPSSSAFSSGRTSHCPAAPGGPRADRRAANPPPGNPVLLGRAWLPLFRAPLRLGGKPRVCSPRAPRFARFAELLLLG